MTTRAWLLVVALAGLGAPPAHAQRSGFIIGFGLGPAGSTGKRTVPQQAFSNSASRVALAMDFHIGGVVGDAVELYWMSHSTFTTTGGRDSGIAATSVSGVGATYPLNPSVSIKGGVGWARQILYYQDLSLSNWDGLGLLAGGRYALTDRWALDLDVMTAGWSEDSPTTVEGRLWSAAVTLNVLSH
jgi:hypothetical protein